MASAWVGCKLSANMQRKETMPYALQHSSPGCEQKRKHCEVFARGICPEGAECGVSVRVLYRNDPSEPFLARVGGKDM